MATYFAEKMRHLGLRGSNFSITGSDSDGSSVPSNKPPVKDVPAARAVVGCFVENHPPAQKARTRMICEEDHRL